MRDFSSKDCYRERCLRLLSYILDFPLKPMRVISQKKNQEMALRISAALTCIRIFCKALTSIGMGCYGLLAT